MQALQFPVTQPRIPQAAREHPLPAVGLRPVMVTLRQRDASGGWKTVEIGRAAFHGWGRQCDEFAEGYGQSSVAIVEFDDGMVETYSPNQIRFLDRGPDAQA